MRQNTVLVLRTCSSDMTSYGGFRWPQSGPVEAPDWGPKPECGGGLHGLLWGEGDGSLLSCDPDAKWIVVLVRLGDIVDLGGKVKFRRGEVVHCGDQKSATEYILSHGGEGRVIVGATVTAGYAGTATAGYWGTATAGDHGTATAGAYGTASAAYGGMARAGDHGVAIVGERGRAMAGEHGVLVMRWYNGATKTVEMRCAYVGIGDDSLKPNTWYKLDESGEFVEVEESNA